MKKERAIRDAIPERFDTPEEAADFWAEHDLADYQDLTKEASFSVSIKQEGDGMLEFDRITFNPAVMGGRACIRGMRITVALVLNLVANGMTADEIIADYPYLEPEDIRQALRYAAWMAEDSVYDLEKVPA